MPRPKLDYDLLDLETRRARGETWAEIGAAYGRDKVSARNWYARNKPKPAAEPASSDADASSDPYAEPARPVEPPEPPSSGPSSDTAPETEGTPLGPDAARAYLPLLFATLDGVAAAGGAWLLRRKLGPRASAELLEQARSLAALNEGEKAALEGVLVAKLAEIKLTPNEALVLTLGGIYAAKALAIMQLDGDGAVVIVAPLAASSA